MKRKQFWQKKFRKGGPQSANNGFPNIFIKKSGGWLASRKASPKIRGNLFIFVYITKPFRYSIIFAVVRKSNSLDKQIRLSLWEIATKILNDQNRLRKTLIFHVCVTLRQRKIDFFFTFKLVSGTSFGTKIGILNYVSRNNFNVFG